MPDSFVTVHKSPDPIEAEIVGDLLVDEGLDARVLGSRSVDAAVWGRGADAIEARVDVRAAEAARARRIIEAHLAEIRPGGPAEEPSEPQAPPPLRRLLAAGVAAVCPGAAHFYARRPLLGVAILAGQAAMLVAMAAAGPRLAGAAGLFACGLFVFDLVGGQLAVGAWNRGARPTRARQLAHAALMFVGVGAFAAAGTPVVARVQQLQRRGHGRSPVQEIRSRAVNPEQLPFPLHLDFAR